MLHTHTHTCTQALHTRLYTQSFYTQMLLPIEACSQSRVYTEQLLHTEAFTQREAFAQRSLYNLIRTETLNTQMPKLLHRQVFTHRAIPRHAFVPEKPYIWSFVPVRYQLDFFHAFSRSILAKKHTLHDGFCQQELKVTIDTEAWCAKPVSQSIKHSSQRLLFIQQLPSYIPSGNFRPNLYANSHS